MRPEGCVRLVTRLTAEAWLTLGLFLVSTLTLVFMDSLVAKPKLLFGRSLSAIAPSLFPKVVLGALALCSGALLVLRAREALHHAPRPAAGDGLGRALGLFAIMLAYALAMMPLGFLISSALAMAAISVVAGNRSVVATAVLALGAPAALYLVSTRLLAVSLPELDTIERAWAHLFALFRTAAPAGPA